MPSRTISSDPRTIARDIPGVTDVLFPRVGYGVAALLNRRTEATANVHPISTQQVRSCFLRPAMLFELGIARGEQLVEGGSTPDWDACLEKAVSRLRHHFNARRPESLGHMDIALAEQVGQSLYTMLRDLPNGHEDGAIKIAPIIPGYQWIASGRADFSVGSTLVEVKCTEANFGAADLRQVLMYWILSYASALEKDTLAWTHIALLNPRHNRTLVIDFLELVRLGSGGLSSIEVIELFSFVTGDYALKEVAELRVQ